jgi:hypothetical protein
MLQKLFWKGRAVKWYVHPVEHKFTMWEEDPGLT